MTTKVINPDSAILQQMDGHWQKLCALLVWKLARQGVTLTHEEIKQCTSEGELILLTHGHYDSIEFRLVTPAEAERIVAHDRTMHGHG